MEIKYNTIETNNSQRLIYIDLLRIFNTFTVIMLHLSAQNWSNVSPQSFTWQVFNVYNSAVRCNVPVFVMISGALFLDSSYNIDLKKLLTKNILRLFTAYIVWSFIYAVLTYIYLGSYDGLYNAVNFIIRKTISSHYHLWYIPMIISVYLMIPILKPMTSVDSAQKLCKYFLILFFIFGIFKPSIFTFNLPYKKYLATIVGLIDIPSATGWLGYLVLGFYLRKYTMIRTKRIIVYCLGVLGFLFCAIGTSIISVKNGTPTLFYHFLFSLSCYFVGISWFVFFKYVISNILIYERGLKIISTMSKNMFGIYLVHVVIIKIFSECGFNTLSCNPIISIPIISVCVFVASYIIVILIKKIPLVSKYIV